MRQIVMSAILALAPVAAMAQWALDSWQVAGNILRYDGTAYSSTPFWDRSYANGIVRDPSGHAVLSISGEFGGKLRWNKPGYLSPTFVYVQLSSSAIVSAGAASPPTLVTESGLPGSTHRGYGGLGYHETSVGRGYQRLDSASGTANFNPITIRAFGSNATDLDAELTFNYKVLPQLLITSPVFEGNYACVNGVRTENVRDRDGMLVLDVALKQAIAPVDGWRYDGGIGLGSNGWGDPTLFTSPNQNAWRDLFRDPRFEWSATSQKGMTSISRWGANMDDMDRAAFAYDALEILPNALRADRETDFAVKLTDAGDSNAPELEAKYKIRWHFPFEDWTQYLPDEKYRYYHDTEIHVPGHATDGLSVGVDIYRTSPYLRVWNAVGGVVIASGSACFSSSVYKALFVTLAAAASIALDAKKETVFVSFNDMWANSESWFGPDGIKRDSRRSSYQMVPKLWQHKWRSIRQGKGYSDKGFTGMELRSVEYFENESGAFGHFFDPGNIGPGHGWPGAGTVGGSAGGGGVGGG